MVPHPQIFGGDLVKSIRTMQLSGMITKDGCCIVEANSNAVAVEDNPVKLKFQLHFEKQIMFDPDMMKKLGNIAAVIGTIAHGHFNCTMRSMLGGQKGCECGSTVVGGHREGIQGMQMSEQKDFGEARTLFHGTPQGP